MKTISASSSPQASRAFRHLRSLRVFLYGVLLCAETTRAGEAPYPDALKQAAISVPSLEGILENALLLGNGDINGLLYSDKGQLVLRVTKNDVWDARVLTENDPPLPTLKRLKELGASGQWGGKGGNDWILPEGVSPPKSDSYNSNAFPCPRACAVVRLGSLHTRPSWTCIRPLEQLMTWENRAEEQVMSAEGIPEASSGYAYGPLTLATDQYTKLKVKLAGSANARFFTDVLDTHGKVLFTSSWLDSPTEPQELVFELPPNRQVSRLAFYTLTKDGKRAENRIESAAFEGDGIREIVDLNPPAHVEPSGNIDIARATVRAGSATLRALAQSNVFLIDSPQPASLGAIVPGDIPAAETGQSPGVQWVKQVIPGDPDWSGMTFAVALAQDDTRKALAVVTSREAADPVAAAIKLASDTLLADAAATIRRHEKIWAEYWNRSGVQLADDFLTQIWYRNLYFFRCVTKHGVISPGLFAGLTTDRPKWHGDYHTNYNLQQTFWTAYNTNQPELAEPYDRLMHGYLPRAQWLAKTIFGLEGAYYPHILYAYEPPHPDQCKSHNGRQYVHHVWGMTLGVTGFTVQPLWWHYKYAPDRERLEKTVYPAIREAALFYANFADQCERRHNGKIMLGPTVSPEHHGWTPNFARNYDCTFDIAMVRYTLNAAIEGAGILGRDAPLVARWEQTLSVLPNYPILGGKAPVVVDVATAHPMTYNITVPTTPVFPGDVVTWWSPEEEKELFARTLAGVLWNGYNSIYIVGVGRARLSMPGTMEWLRAELQARMRPNQLITSNRLGDRFNDFGHYTEQFAASMAIGELLLQSVGDIIRVFPAWPKDKDASFTTLRAQGGFLVSAVQKSGKVTQIEITSTVAGKLRILDPWNDKIVEREMKPDENFTLTQ